MKLSIGRAWDETRGILRSDGGPILAIALALAVLPGAILETASPSALRGNDAPMWVGIAGLLTALLSLASQLAVSRIALGPPTTVGGALGQAFRRMPALFGALLLVITPFVLLVGGIGLSQGTGFNAQNLPPALAFPLLAILLAGLFVLVRLMFLTPLAADGESGPIALLKEAWALSRGRFGKLVLMLLLLMLVAALLLLALGGALSAVLILALGDVAPFNLSAVLVALVQQVLATIVSLLFVITVCRLYVQVRGGGASEASVPHAGSQ